MQQLRNEVGRDVASWLSLAPAVTLFLSVGYPLYSLYGRNHPEMGLPAHPGCAFKALSGLPCPYCGHTRSMVHLYEGEPTLALAYQPMALFFVAFLGYLTWRSHAARRDGRTFRVSNREFAIFVGMTALAWVGKFVMGPAYY